MLRLALGQVRAHAVRYLATMLAIALAVGFVLASVGLVRTLTASVESSFGARYAGTAVIVQHVGDRTAARDEAGRVAAADQEARALEIIGSTPGVRAVAVDRLGYVQLRAEGEASRGTTVSVLAGDDALRWQPVTEGRVPAAPGEVAVPAGEGLEPGERVRVQSSSSEPVELTVVGLLDLAGQPDMRTALPLFVAEEQMGAWFPQGAGGDVRVAAAEGVDEAGLRAALAERLAPLEGSDSFVYTAGDAAARKLSATFMGDRSVYTGVLYAFTVLAVAVAALVIASTFAVLFAARAREVALLRTLGAARWQVAASSLAETALVAAVASGLGLLAGRGMMRLIVDAAPRLGVELPLDRIEVPPEAWWLAAGVGVAMAVAASLPPILRSVRVGPLVALRPLDVRPEPWWRSVLAVVVGGVLAGAAAPVLLGAVRGREVVVAAAAGVACFVGFLVVVRALVPVVTGLVGTVIGWTLGATGLLGARYTARSPRRTGATAAALVIGVTLLSTLVVGYHAVSPAVEDRLVNKAALDVVVADREGVLPAGLAERVAGAPGVAAAEEVTVMPTEGPDGKSTLVRVVSPDQVASLMRRPVAAPRPGEIVLPQSAAVAVGARTGDRVAFTFFDDDVRELTVRRSTDQWAMVSPEDAPPWPVATTPWGGPWPEGVEVPRQFIPRSELWLRMASAEETPEVARGLDEVRRAATDAAPTVAVTEAFRSREQVRASVRRALTASVLLLAVAVVIAVVGVVNTMVLAVAERARENALLRGVGMTRGNLRLMMLFEALLVGVVAAAAGALAGVALGTLGAGALVGWADARAAAVPWVLVAAVAVGGVVAALVAAWITSLGALRRSPVEL